MTDDRVRELERRWQASGTLADEQAYLRERARGGDREARLLLGLYDDLERLEQQAIEEAGAGEALSCGVGWRICRNRSGGQRRQAARQRRARSYCTARKTAKRRPVSMENDTSSTNMRL